MPKRELYARPVLVLWLTAAGLAAPSMAGRAAAQPAAPAPCAACLVPIVSPGQTVLLPAALNGIEVLLSPEREPGAAGALGDAVQAIRRAGGRPGLLLRAVDEAPPDGLADLHRVVLVMPDAVPAAELSFRARTRLTELRASYPSARIGAAGDPAVVRGLLAGDLAPYVDFVALRSTARPPYPWPAAADGEVLAVVSAAGDAAALTPAAASAWIARIPADALDAVALLGDLARAAPLLGAGLLAGGTADVRCGGGPVPTYLDPASLDTIAVAARCAGAVTVTPPVDGVERVALSNGDVLVRVPAAEGRFAEGVDVRGARDLTVDEVVARHQAAAARQRRMVERLISTGHMTLTFEAPGFPAPMAITSESVIFAGPDRVEIEQRDIRVNGIAFRGGGVPRLPLLEPERVASPPLAITLGDLYRYALEGQEEAAGVRCYVVAFEPVDPSRPLFAGRAWIAADSFAMVKVSAVQTGLRGPIVSSEQQDVFRPEGEELWLLHRSEVRQLYEGAGHRTPIHRVLTIARHEVNPAAFEARRTAAYASPSIMLRDTPEGFRYLQRTPAGTEGAEAIRAVPVVAGPANRVRTIVGGAIIDPNISRPLPFAGLSYVDFDLFGSGTQLNAFFGGTYAQAAVSVPSLGGTRWQLAGRAFGIASSYNDRAFVNGREQYALNISQRPAHASAWLLRPLSARVSARIGYDFDYTGFGRSESTAASFVVPASQAAHALRLALEGQWRGWAGSVWWAGARRAGWRPWGPVAGGAFEGYRPAERDYQRWGSTLTRSIVVSPRLVGRIEGAWMGGRDLDRFSRYAFGSFDNRLRGYPAALIRYDRGGVVRAAAAWAAAPLLRIDGFADTAFVRDPGFGAGHRRYTGIGAAAEVPAPFGTLLAVEWGYGFQGIDANGRRGTQVVRISGYKMF